MYNLPNGFIDEIFEIIGAFIVTFSIFAFIGSAIGLVLYILNALGIMKMSASLNISNGWFGFIPILSVFQLGRIGQRYILRDGRKSAKFGIWLLVLEISKFILGIVLAVANALFIYSTITFAEDAVLNDTSMSIDMFSGIIPVIIVGFIVFAVGILYAILYYVNLWRVYAIFDIPNATLFLVLSILFSFTTPIFLFIIRKRVPKVSFAERMGYIPNIIEEEPTIILGD